MLPNAPATGLPAKTLALIEQTLEHMGFALVRVRFIAGKSRSTLQIMAEPADGSIMTIEGCEAISRRLSPLLEVEDPIAEAWNLEISSPGLDRPLVRAGDFERYKGYEIKVELAMLVDGRRKFRGILEGLDGETVLLTEENDKHCRIALDTIREAKLVLNEQRIQEALKGTAA